MHTHSFRDVQAGRGGELTTGLAGQARLCVRVMAVHTDCGILIAFIEGDLMYAVVRLVVLLFVAFLAGIQETQCEVAHVFYFYIRMGIIADVRVTVDTGDSFFAVN